MRKSLYYLIVSTVLLALVACQGAAPAQEEAAPAAVEAPSTAASETTAGASCDAEWTPGMTVCEAPMLAAKVAAGELPPVEERVPLEPLVGNPRIPWTTMEKGVHGGTLRLIDYDAGTIGHDAGWANNEQWMETAGLSHDAATMVGGVFKGLDVSADEKEFTFHMRKGMKFSNGADFTTEDVAFWWNDVINNPQLTPAISQNFRAGHKPDGNPPTFAVIDDYTFQFTFDQPYGGWSGLMTYGAGLGNITDSDYLKQIHVDYATPEDLAAKVKERGFEDGEWYRMWGYYLSTSQQHNTGLPTYGAWVLTNMTETSAKLERNPYYWKVDEWGQQLPYIDTVEVKIVQDVDAAAVEIIAGNVDLARRPVNPANLPLYAQYADEKGYVVHIQDQHASLGEVFLNITYENPIWQEFMGNPEFRKALSMAVDRTQIIDAVYFGIAHIPTTIAVPDYDPDGARAIFDSLGLDQTDADGCRLGPDGKPFTIPFEMAEFTGEEIPVGELVAKFWTEVGICTTVKQIETNLFLTKTGANESQAFTWWAHYPRWPFHENGDYIGQAWQQTYAPLWMRWVSWNLGGGREAAENPDETDPKVVGIEPPQAYLDLRTKQDELFATADPNVQKQLWDEMRQIISENYFWIPIVDPVQGPLIVNAKLGNVAETGVAIENAAAAEWFFYKP
ncbi:MAG: hypothetical protein KF832_09420 [Caldilineaceae bacterium]|nr:hypothetical protein [Caldilineaceae bacterium]